MDINESPRKFVTVNLVALAQRNGVFKIVRRRAQAVYARHTRHDYGVLSLAKRRGCRVAKFVDFLVDLQILFDIGVRARNVRLGLIIIVIGNEKLHSVFWEKLAEFVAKLSGERLVVRNHERGLLHTLDNIRHSKSFARARYTQQNFRVESVLQTFNDFFYCLGLIARGLVFAYKFKFHLFQISLSEQERNQLAYAHTYERSDDAQP